MSVLGHGAGAGELTATEARSDRLACPGCGETDYLPLGGGWRRCWACGRRWGPGPDPGDARGLDHLAGLLGLLGNRGRIPQGDRRRRGWSVGAVQACPRCGNRAYSAPEREPGSTVRRCDGPNGCGHIWDPETTGGMR